ncbi:ephrin-A4 isoform X2 [Lagenorhynchus albirostris]|uniref:ephrin-A4 isoform X2 n=1 Tax=Lagenorhynchus albirostris TaxID=27610 RepID=UPI0028EA621B|nr:ephrin-A4 isoform X2 [Lagenorhynchus albirostris]
MRLQPLLRTVLWAALLSSPLRGGCGLRHEVYWNSSNPRLLRGDAVVELGLKDYLDIFCPHYEGPGPPEGPETFALYMVGWPGYEACRAEGPGAFKRWECSLPFAPFGPVRFSEKIQRFTPFSLGFEFLPGETYYYILPTPESPGQCLRLQVSVCCKEDRRLGFDGIGSLSLLGAKAEDLGTGDCWTRSSRKPRLAICAQCPVGLFPGAAPFLPGRSPTCLL